MKKILLTTFLTLSLASQALSAGLSSEIHVTDKLVSVRVADKIRKQCDDISPRIFYVYNQANSLKQWALNKGYTEKEIELFLDDDDEKERVYKLADIYIEENKGDSIDWCQFGFSEIDSGSYIGSFLR